MYFQMGFAAVTAVRGVIVGVAVEFELGAAGGMVLGTCGGVDGVGGVDGFIVVGGAGVDDRAIVVDGRGWWVAGRGGERSSCRSRSRSRPGLQASRRDSTRSSVGPQRAVPAAF